MFSIPSKRAILQLTILAALLTGCDTGTITLSLTDAPIDRATRVVVQIEAAEFVRNDGGSQRFDFNPPLRPDVYALRNGLSLRLIDSADLETGDYRSLRLFLRGGDNASDSFIALNDGSINALRLTGVGADAGSVEIAQSFKVDRGDRLAFTVDFNLRASVLEPAASGQAFRLRPALRIVNDDRVGIVTGSIADSRVPDGCSPAVYIYDGADATPDDVGSATPPLSAAIPTLNTLTGQREYRLAFLPPGRYTLALTCAAADDNPETNDSIGFGAPVNLEVESGRTTTINIS